MKEYNVGIMGTGGIATTMVDTISKMEHVTCYAVASRTQARADEYANEHNIPVAYGDYASLAADDSLDLIYIATPHSEHFANAILCIKHKKPVLLEKAFTVNAKQARELLDLAKKNNVFLTEAIWVRYMPFIHKIREVIDSGIIGKPTMLTANLGYDIDSAKRMTDPNLAGGALLDVGIYPLNFASMFFGMDIKAISSACTYTETGVDEQNSITLIYEDNKMAVLNSSMLSISDRKGIIHGDKGFIVIENINNFESLTVYNAGYEAVAHYDRPEQISGYEYEVLASLKAIDEGKLECSDMPHSETIRMMEMMDEIRKQWGIKYPME